MLFMLIIKNYIFAALKLWIIQLWVYCMHRFIYNIYGFNKAVTC